MAELLRNAANVAMILGPITVAALLALFVHHLNLKHRESQLQSLPEDQRARAIDQMASRYGLDAANLTREQKYELILREMDIKERTARLGLKSGAVVIVILVATTAASYVWRPAPPPSPENAPKQFSVETYETCWDPRFPREVFGAPDDAGKPLHWLESIERGAYAELQVKQEDARLFWLLTDTFEHGLAGCTLYVNVGTRQNAFVMAFLVMPDGFLKAAHLLYTGEQGPMAEYTFDVPESRTPARLLVCIALRADAYDGIKRDTKFYLRSRRL